MILTVGSFFMGESCGNFIKPHKYNDRNIPMMIQMPINISRLRIPQCVTRSAFERNLNARASSRKPRITFTVVSQPPDFGNELSKPGNKANKPKGSASARPKPAMPAVSCIAPPSAVSEPANNEPRMGPVQENETNASVSAIKNIPTQLPPSALLSVLLEKEEGRVISK